MPTPADGTVLVRLPVRSRDWARQLPRVPDGRVLTLTVGHVDLLPVPVDDLVDGGYRVVGVAAEHRPLGHSVDVLVPPELRTAHPAWWGSLAAGAERIFDLAHGPVQRVLAAEIDLHLTAAPG